MNIVLDAFSALEFWLSSLSRTQWDRVLGHASLTSFERGSCRDITKAIARADGAPGKLELLVKDKSERLHSEGILCNAWGARPLAPGSVCHVSDEISVISPELCLMRMAERVSRTALLRIMTDFLGIYGLFYFDRADLVERTPITSRERIADYARGLRGARGTRAVSSCLGWVPERSASPRETSMNLMLALSTRVGGMGLPRFEANKRIDPTPEASRLTTRSFLVADVAYEDGPLLEYNSNKYHDTEEQQVMDFEKITALHTMGYTVIPVSTRQFNDFDAFCAIVDSVRRGMHSRDRYGEGAYLRRMGLHDELLRIERVQREAPSLAETARWRFLFPRMSL